MDIFPYSLGKLQANCYLLIQNSECLIIDPADDASFILEELQRRNCKLVGMLATHGHFDHLMAAGEIQKSFNVPLYINKKDLFLIKRLIETAEHFLEYKPAIIQPINIKYLEEGILKINPPAGGWQLEILFTPGHTPGSTCLFSKEAGVLFTGDTIFKDAIGRYDHSYSSQMDLRVSLQKILSFPKETKIYPGHGEQTTIKDEKLHFN